MLGTTAAGMWYRLATTTDAGCGIRDEEGRYTPTVASSQEAPSRRKLAGRSEGQSSRATHLADDMGRPLWDLLQTAGSMEGVVVRPPSLRCWVLGCQKKWIKP